MTRFLRYAAPILIIALFIAGGAAAYSGLAKQEIPLVATQPRFTFPGQTSATCNAPRDLFTLEYTRSEPGERAFALRFIGSGGGSITMSINGAPFQIALEPDNIPREYILSPIVTEAASYSIIVRQVPRSCPNDAQVVSGIILSTNAQR